MTEYSSITVGIIDSNPIHIMAFEDLASGNDFMRVVICDSVEEIASRLSGPDLVLVNSKHHTDCSNLLLFQALNTFSEAVVMYYSPGQWTSRRVFEKHSKRLIVLTYDEVVETFQAYVSFWKGKETGQRTLSGKQKTPMDGDLDLVLTRLSPKEREVLCLLGKGLGTPEIADILGRSQHTIDSHLKNIRGKLQFKGMVELRSIAVRFAQTGCCRVFSRYDSHICPHLDGESVGYCPLHDDD